MAATSSLAPNNHTPSLPPSAMPLISPSALLQAHLSRDPPIRPSHRSPTQFRTLSLNTSSLTHANGSALVRVGDTAVVCGVRAEILPVSEIANYRVRKTQSAATSGAKEGSSDLETDHSEITNLNLLVPNIELSTGCSPTHLPGLPPSSEAQSLSQRLLSLLHVSGLVRPSDLRIYYHPPPEASVGDENPETNERALKAYWTLYIDIVVISYGGGIFDAAWFALYAALKDTVLPRAWWDMDEESVLCSPNQAEAKSLQLNGCPVPMSFGVFVPEVRTGGVAGAQKWVLCDVDAFEEGCCTERGTVTVDKDDVGKALLLKVEKSGGGGVGTAELRQLNELAGLRWTEWNRVLQEAKDR